MLVAGRAYAQGTEDVYPAIETREWGIDILYEGDAQDAIGITALAWWDGLLYATRPLSGEVVVLQADASGVYHERVIAQGLTYPNALLAHNEGLYIVAGGDVYRLGADASLTVIAEDIPHGGGLWTGGIAIYEDWLLVGTGAPCEGCAHDDAGRGAIWAYRLNEAGFAEEGRVVIRGLRSPSGLLVHEGMLWVTDTARRGLIANEGFLDEINRLPLYALLMANGEPVHLGYPYCIGIENTPDPEHNPNGEVFDCSQVVAPIYALETGSHPQALVFYGMANSGGIEDALLVAMMGSVGRGLPRGYGVMAIRAGENIPSAKSVVPVDWHTHGNDVSIRTLGAGWRFINTGGNYWNARNKGFFPNRVYGLAMDEGGRLYVSWGQANILRLTPTSN